MKKIVFSVVLVAAGATVFVTSCKKESTTVKLEHATAKAWFDTRCAQCHASGGPNVSDWYYNPNDYNTSIKNNINRIYNEILVDKSMPDPLGPNSADSATFKAWYDAGYPAK